MEEEGASSSVLWQHCLNLTWLEKVRRHELDFTGKDFIYGGRTTINRSPDRSIVIMHSVSLRNLSIKMLQMLAVDELWKQGQRGKEVPRVTHQKTRTVSDMRYMLERRTDLESTTADGANAKKFRHNNSGILQDPNHNIDPAVRTSHASA